ncbi:MAG: pyridoxal phosphate-dependent class II aminotransferase [Clostridia bacterium]|nr:pyridoxal phosphate-dependent class II aminotransferase [Clostridia bacterium]
MIHGGNVWQGNGPDTWLDFSANLRPEGPPGWILSVIQRAVSDIRYYPDLTLRGAREGIARYLGVPERQVLPTAGGAAAIDMVLSLRTGPVLIQPPTFGEYASRAKVHGRPLLEITVPHDVRHIGSDADFVLCNPNNPTGDALTADTVLDIAEKLKSHSCELIVDEAFIDFCPSHSVRRYVSPALTVVGSLTKLFGIPGIRLGYIISTPEIIAVLEKRQLPWALNTFAAAIAAALPLHVNEILTDIQLNQARRERFSHSLSELGAHVFPSQTNFLLVRFNTDMRPITSRLRDLGILVRTCESFGLDEHYLRLAVKDDAQNILLLEALSSCLKS